MSFGNFMLLVKAEKVKKKNIQNQKAKSVKREKKSRKDKQG